VDEFNRLAKKFSILTFKHATSSHKTELKRFLVCCWSVRSFFLLACMVRSLMLLISSVFFFLLLIRIEIRTMHQCENFFPILAFLKKIEK
jgi:hypothetical protein